MVSRARFTIFVQVLMEPAVVAALDRIAYAERISRSAVVRRFIAEGLHRRGDGATTTGS